jgi:type IV pilus assembly protein PilN
MIRINLLGVDRTKARKAPAFDVGQQLTLLCSLILVAAALGIGWWYWTLNGEATRVEAEIAAAQREQARLASLLTEVTQFEAQRAQLQQRVRLIEELRAGQSVPVQLLDHVSRSVPEMLWLTALQQEDDELTIQGRSTTLIALSDFVANLGTTPLFKKPVEIIKSTAQQDRNGVELVEFTVKATLASAPAPQAPARGAAAPKR